MTIRTPEPQAHEATLYELVSIDKLTEAIFKAMELVRSTNIFVIVDDVGVRMVYPGLVYTIYELSYQGWSGRFCAVAGEPDYMAKRNLYSIIWDLVQAGERQHEIEEPI